MAEATPPPARRIISGRYELSDLLGSGGMGRVYRAHDARLRRTIALKLLIGGGAEADQRLLQEAQSQARVEHENVCRVYEVGWGEEGEPFIVMQLVEGEALSDAAAKMSFEQRAKVMAQVCEAVHAANRLGVIHRDLKPGNVLMERTGDGEWKPYVTDFGLARDVTSGAKMTGSVVGTPNYMAPEQARGESARIDRRTDVYGLGATLYEVLSNQLPFDGNPYDILQQVLRDDPKPLRRIDPAIPRDLAAITRKCMEKDPDQRYDSARAVALDLRRWLDGEPIEAQPPDLAYRIRRWIKRHRTWALVVAAALATGIAALLIGGRSRSRARQMAEEFGQDVKEIEGKMRFALVLPLHDLSDEEAEVRERMGRIASAMKPLGKEGVGPGEYALGRGALALGDADGARVHFQRAWDAGYRSAECATGLGLSLVTLYRDGLHQVNRIADKRLRDHRREELALRYKVPAKAALQAGFGASTEPAEYVEALIRYCDEDLDGAERAARAALLQAPWLYEARILLGQVHRERGLRRRAAGDDEAAVAEFEKARDHLQVSVQFGRSDPRAWSELCGLWVDEMALLLARGSTLEAAPDSVFTACESGIKASPGRADGYLLSAAAQRTWAEVLLRDGRDAQKALEAAVTSARRGLSLRSGPDAASELGLSLRLRALDQAWRGLDAAPAAKEAVEALRRVWTASPDHAPAALALALALGDQAALLADRELDPAAPLAEARALLARARVLEPESLAPQTQAARLLLVEARTRAPSEARPLVEQAVAGLQAVTAISQAPADLLALAQAFTARAELDQQEGADPAVAVQRALGALEQLGPQARSWPEALLLRGNLHRLLAERLLFQQKEPDEECELALNALDLGAEPRPAFAEAAARVLLARAGGAAQAGSDRRRRLQQAADGCAKAAGWLRAALARGAPQPRLRRLLEALEREEPVLRGLPVHEPPGQRR